MAIPHPDFLGDLEEEILKNIMDGALIQGAGISKISVSMGKLTIDNLEDFWLEHTRMKKLTNKCVYCDGELEEVKGNKIWPARDDLAKHRFMICWQCSAWAGMTNDGVLKGYPAKQHIRELRGMILSSWHHICDTGAMPYRKADEFRGWLKGEHGFDTSDLGWLEEDELRTLLGILDKILIPDTPEVDALFK